MDLFETSIQQLLQKRKEIAFEIVKKRKESMCEESQEELADTSIQDRLPYSISKTVQYLKADEYMRNKKSLKQQKESI